MKQIFIIYFQKGTIKYSIILLDSPLTYFTFLSLINHYPNYSYLPFLSRQYFLHQSKNSNFKFILDLQKSPMDQYFHENYYYFIICLILFFQPQTHSKSHFYFHHLIIIYSLSIHHSRIDLKDNYDHFADILHPRLLLIKKIFFCFF